MRRTCWSPSIAGSFALSPLNQSKMILLRFLQLPGSEPNRLFQSRGRLIEVAFELPGSAEVGGEVKVVRMFALRGPQHLKGLRRLAQANVQRTEVGEFVGAEFALTGRLLQFGDGLFVLGAQRVEGDARTRFDRKVA